MVNYDRSDNGLHTHSAQAERHVLGSLIGPYKMDDGLVGAVLECLQDRHRMFYVDSNHRIFTCVQGLVEANAQLSPESVTELLRRKGWLEEVGGELYIEELLGHVCARAEAVRYAGIVRDAAAYREYTRTRIKAEGMCSSGEIGVMDVIKKVAGKSSELSAKSTAGIDRRIIPIGKMTLKEEKVGKGMPTGLTDFDKATGGLRAGELTVIGGRTSMGKTALALTIVRNVAIRERKSVLLFSLEMVGRELLERIYGAEANINTMRIRDDDLSAPEHMRIASVEELLRDVPLFIKVATDVTVSDIEADVEWCKGHYGLDLVVIDHIGLIVPEKRTGNLNSEMTIISRALKSLTMKFGVPVLALAQLNRDPDKRQTDKRPRKSDLRDSGSIEQDANNVVLLYREYEYARKDPNMDDGAKALLENMAEIIIDKNRGGPNGTITVKYVASFARFEDLPQRPDNEGGLFENS